MSRDSSPSLKRELGVLGAILIGLGSMVGTGVFVSVGIAAGVAGAAVILAVAIAAVGVGSYGAEALSEATQAQAAPLEIAARLDQSERTPYVAVIVIGVAIAGLVLIGNVKTTWSFSSFTVLVYYALTNLSALKLSPTERLYPQWIAWVGLAGCLFLAFWVEQQIWLIGLGLIVLSLVWKMVVLPLVSSWME